MATLHQVILRRTGVYILPGEPANRWIIETPTITEGLRHRVRRILGPCIEELTELGVAIAQDSRAVLATMSYTEFDEFTADWKHLRGARGGRAFRRDFDMRQPHLSDRQRYTEQILHYITRSIATGDLLDAFAPREDREFYAPIYGHLKHPLLPYDTQDPRPRTTYRRGERDQNQVILLRGNTPCAALAQELFTAIAVQNQVYSETDRTDLLTLADYLRAYHKLPALEHASAYRENLAFLTVHIDRCYVQQMRTLNEVLRLAVAFSGANGNEADLSLSTPTRLRLRRSERTLIARLINRLCERDYAAACYDTASHSEQFKRLARTIHPGDYPSLTHLQRWADDLYRGRMRSFESEVDAAYRSKNAEQVVRLLSSRPGVFARQLSRAFRTFPDEEQVIADGFARIAPRVALPVLVQLYNLYTNLRRGSTQHRLVIDKAGMGTVTDASRYTRTQVQLGLQAIENGFAARLENTKIYTPDGMDIYTPTGVGKLIMPLGNRNSSQSLDGLCRFSRVPLHEGAHKIIRLFVYWDSPADIDLSLMLYDAKGEPLGGVWYGDQQVDDYAYHSGDVTDGTGGAWEFIDLNIAEALAQKVRYAIPTVHLYAGYGGTHVHGPQECPCQKLYRQERTLADVNDLFVGFTMVPRAGAGKDVHEVSQVRTKFMLTSAGRGSLPLIFDLRERAVTVTDVGLRGYINIVESARTVQAMLETFRHHRPMTVADYLALTWANVVETPNEADIRLEPTVASLSQLYLQNTSPQ